MAGVRWFVLFALLVSVATAGAQEAESNPAPGRLERAGLTGSMRAAYWSSTRDLDRVDHVGAGMAWLKLKRPVSESVSFLAEGWMALSGPAADPDTTGELREAFVDVRRNRLDVRAGRQILAWGRADGVNPTDNLTGEDLTLLAPDDDDRRLGTVAVRISYYFGDVSVSGYLLPEFRGHRFPLPSPPPGLTFSRDAPDWPGDQWAVRVEQTGRAIDWSLSYFDGLDLLPDLGLPAAAASSRAADVIAISHHRVRILGADMAAAAGRFGLRAEGAYVHTEDPNGRDPSIKNPFVFLVAGTDRTVREHLNLNVQYLFRFVREFSAIDRSLPPLEAAVAAQQAVLGSQTHRFQHGASFRAAYQWLHDTLEAECAAAGYVEPRGLAIRPKVTYAVTDHWKAVVGAEIFGGQPASIFGLLEPNSTVYFEARWSF